MPRIIRGLESLRRRFPKLLEELVDELRCGRSYGQPMIYEQHFPETNAIRITIVWDKWEGLADDERIDAIRQAYEITEGSDYCDRIVLAMGLTVAEASESGMLPVQVVPALRKGDAVTSEQCRQAMIDAGASVALGEVHPVLRFATLEEAEQTVRRLTELLPGSEQVWLITHEILKSSA